MVVVVVVWVVVVFGVVCFYCQGSRFPPSVGAGFRAGGCRRWSLCVLFFCVWAGLIFVVGDLGVACSGSGVPSFSRRVWCALGVVLGESLELVSGTKIGIVAPEKRRG